MSKDDISYDGKWHMSFTRIDDPETDGWDAISDDDKSKQSMLFTRTRKLETDVSHAHSVDEDEKDNAVSDDDVSDEAEQDDVVSDDDVLDEAEHDFFSGLEDSVHFMAGDEQADHATGIGITTHSDKEHAINFFAHPALRVTTHPDKTAEHAHPALRTTHVKHT